MDAKRTRCGYGFEANKRQASAWCLLRNVKDSIITGGGVWLLTNLEDILVDKIVCCNSRKDRVIFFYCKSTRSLHKNTKEHEVFKRITVTSEIKLFANLPLDVRCKFFACVSNPFGEISYIWPRKHCASKQYVATDDVTSGTRDVVPQGMF